MKFLYDFKKYILNFIAPEFCIVNDVPIKSKTEIDFLSREFFDSLQYAVDSKDIMIRLLKKFENDDLHINSANAMLDIKKNDNYRLILHQIKYNSMQKMGFGMGKLLGKKLIADNMADYDFICPVPVHKIRLRERGYNQAEIIAGGVSESIGIKMIPDLLKRDNYNVSQTKLSATERLKNVKKSFAINNRFSVKNKSVLLIDDILTTGSTLNNCALVLMNEGAKKVDVCTLALA